MHAPPHFQMTLRHQGMWRAGSAFCLLATVGVLGGWSLSAASVHPVWVILAWGLLGVAAWALLSHAWGTGPVSLRWDGQRWFVGPASTVGLEPAGGRLDVMLDLGPWMLLRFSADEDFRRHGPVRQWLPAQRFGHEADWHLLRATVYCARPASPAAAPF
jgi:hypothetical protein